MVWGCDGPACRLSAIVKGTKAVAFALALVFGATLPVDAEALDGQWREKNQLVWDETARQLVRKVIRVWDLEPGRNLEFYWDPAPGAGQGAGEAIEGRGTLTWRRAGSANYERASIYSTYVGEMKSGRPNGRGRLELHTGTTYEGDWVAGLMEGEGTLRLTSGDVYTGEFRHGLMHGKGRYVAANGETYEGEFANGERHGMAIVVSPKGGQRSTLWAGGQEVGRQGLLQRAQARPDTENDVTISVTTDTRKNSEMKDAGGLVVTYVDKIGAGEVAVAPDDERFMNIWKGGGQMYHLQEELATELPDYSQAFYEVPAFLKVRIASAGARGASVKSLRLDVAESQSDRQPFLGVLSSLPDGLLYNDQPSGYNPALTFVNTGWGGVANAKLTASFKAEGSASSSRTFTKEVNSFDQLKRISVERELKALGVDVAQLRSLNYTCPDVGQMQACQRDVLSKLRLGELEPNVGFLKGGRHLVTYVSGTLSYQWKDQSGAVRSSSSPFEVRVPLGEIQPRQPAEYSGPDLPSAGVQLFELTPDRRVYQLPYALKSPTALNAIGRDFVLGLFAKKSSTHRLRVVAELTDGREIASLPVVLTYARPRPMPETADGGEESTDDARQPAPTESPMSSEQQSTASTNVGHDSSCEDLWIARNQVFKDAGYCFATAKARNFFGNEGCRFRNQDEVPLGAKTRSFILQVRELEARKRC